MRIVTFAAIKKFCIKHPDAEIPLRDWYSKTKNAEWTSFGDIRNTFNSTDYVGNDRFVFNIKGNRYRVVAIVIFASKKVYIRFIGSHAEYDKITDIKSI
ncbi:MAG: type II toxin-antitoxin system HigB family toxin [Bacteroidales bacterium]|jgi:mRNA interferase HigB|nr:type II toxin-antitoxin system HigB family toxin [Bacteroidales bacterium]